MFNEIEDELPLIDGRNYKFEQTNFDVTHMRLRRKWVYVLTDKPDRVVPEFQAETDGVFSDLRQFSDTKISESAFYIHFSRAEWALPSLRRIVDCKGLFASPPVFAKQPFHLVSAKALDSYNEAGRMLGHEPYIGLEVQSQLCQAVELTKHVQGDFVEVGVYTGSSALTALTHMRNVGVRRRCWLLDTYSGFTYGAAKESADMIWSGTHLMNQLPQIDLIQQLMQHTGQDVHVVPNEICSDPLPDAIQRVALANIDVDLYDATLAALVKIGPRMVHRGIMVAEDPTAVPSLYGAYLAMNEFLQTEVGRDFTAIRTTTQYFLIRVQD